MSGKDDGPCNPTLAAKTAARMGHPAVMACDEGREYFFYTGEGMPKTAVTDWQWRLRKIYDDAGIPDGHSHRLRDTFSVIFFRMSAARNCV